MSKTTKKSESIVQTANNLTIKPLMGYVVIEPDNAATTTASGIYLPESAQERPAQGVVVATSGDFVLDSGRVLSSPVKIRDRVVYKKWGGDEIKVNGKEYKLVKFEDLMAILE